MTTEHMYLCRAWGETDLPCADILEGLDAVRAFFIREWTGHDDPETLTPIMKELAERDWKAEGAWHAEFEIGGVSVEVIGTNTPPRKPLTEQEIIKVWGAAQGTRNGYAPFARAIEAAHGTQPPV